MALKVSDAGKCRMRGGMEKGSPLIAFPLLAWKFTEEKGGHAWKRMGQLCFSGQYFVL